MGEAVIALLGVAILTLSVATPALAGPAQTLGDQTNQFLQAHGIPTTRHTVLVANLKGDVAGEMEPDGRILLDTQYTGAIRAIVNGNPGRYHINTVQTVGVLIMHEYLHQFGGEDQHPLIQTISEGLAKEWTRTVAGVKPSWDDDIMVGDQAVTERGRRTVHAVCGCPPGSKTGVRAAIRILTTKEPS